jgi:hypothetical protein
MKTEFVNRSGERLVIEISTHDPCPECCGGLEPMGDANAPRGYRCRSCGLVFLPVKADDSK